jgi:cytochrome c oxidase cbb3-type subunit 3
MASKTVALTDLHAGGPPTTQSHVSNPYDENAYAMSEGKRLYQQFNCVGCHANGGGDKGPPLMDDKWIYGSSPEQIHSTIVEGRPNGMPSFRNKIPDYQVWQIAAYVRSMSGLTSPQAAPARDDHMQTKQPENSVSTQPPKSTGIPPSSERPE